MVPDGPLQGPASMVRAGFAGEGPLRSGRGPGVDFDAALEKVSPSTRRSKLHVTNGGLAGCRRKCLDGGALETAGGVVLRRTNDDAHSGAPTTADDAGAVAMTAVASRGTRPTSGTTRHSVDECRHVDTGSSRPPVCGARREWRPRILRRQSRFTILPSSPPTRTPGSPPLTPLR